MLDSKSLIEKEKTTQENRVWVRISAACNNKCVFCLDEHSHDGVLIESEKVKKEILEKYKEGQFNRIVISGGEASINPRFPDYIAYAKSVGYKRIQTVTNGNMFVNLDFCKRVFDAGLQEVTFSFHGHTPALHDYLVDVPGAFKKSLQGIIYVKKFFPQVIVNIDIVVNKVNIRFLPDIIRFFMKLGVYEFDILHIIPFGKGFKKYKDILFFHADEYLTYIHEAWDISRKPGVHMWSNRFPVTAFEGYEDLIQDPRKIKSEVTGETDMYEKFIQTNGKQKPKCYGDACKYCFLEQYCHDFLNHTEKHISQEEVYCLNPDEGENIALKKQKYVALRSEAFPSEIYKKFGKTQDDFRKTLQNLSLRQDQELLNVPLCIRKENNNGRYEFYPDVREAESNIEEYTQKYISNFYRKKFLSCKKCIYNDTCEGIHINFIRSYGFSLLTPITREKDLQSSH